MRFLLTGLLVCAVGLGLCCLWDSDTVAMELKGMPELQDVVAGRFERNPDLYYEMRLARYEKMDRTPFLEEYFDLAVACDRLGRHDEAIGWIKAFDEDAARVKMSESKWKEVSYKRNANLGTFYIHRGLKKGNEGLADLKKGLELIEKAIEINPEAHFGREKVQAALVRQMIWRGNQDEKIAKLESEGKEDEAEEVGWENPPETGLTREEIREGVIGLMVLGNAWEAPVAWHWLLGTLKVHDGNLAVLIEQRLHELDPVYEKNHREDLPDPLINFHAGVSQEGRIKRVYSDLRANGEKWAQHREAFMLQRLQGGKHPDTDEDFWEGYEEVPGIEIKDNLFDRFRAWSSMPGSQILLAMGGAMALVIGVFVWKRVRSAQRV